MEFLTNFIDGFRALITNEWAPGLAFIAFALGILTWVFGGAHNSKHYIAGLLIGCGALVAIGRVWYWFSSRAGGTVV